MKLSKKLNKLHNQAEKILEKDILTHNEKIFIFENWQEGALNMNSLNGAFFTPWGLARDFSLELNESNTKGATLVDLCAGIGVLSYIAYHRYGFNVTCIEKNYDYLRVGKKILPEATWIHGSILDFDILEKAGTNFDLSISNPPFGKIKGDSDLHFSYKGSEFEFKTIEIASKISKAGTFILPQTSTPYKYSGNRIFEEVKPMNKTQKFIDTTKLNFEFNTGIDTSIYLNDWKGVTPKVEIVNFDFSESKELRRKQKIVQSDLFDVSFAS